MVIQASIVRVMKSRRQLSFTDLMSQVTASLVDTFVPRVEDIEKNITTLMEKEYIRKLEDTTAVHYEYIA